MPPKKRTIVMSGVTTPASSGDVISPSMAARLSRLDAAASWTEEPAKRVAESVTEQPADVIADLVKVAAKVNAEATADTKSGEEATERPQDAKNDATHADALDGSEKTRQEPLTKPVTLDKASAETGFSEKQAPSDVSVEQISVGREAFGSSHVIDSMQVAALRIGSHGPDRSEEDAASLTPPPAPATAAPSPAAVPVEAAKDPVADLMRSLPAEALAKLVQMAAGKAQEVEPQAEAEPAVVTADDADEDSLPPAGGQAPAKTVRRRKRALPWDDQSNSGLKKRFTMEVPIELHNRLEFLAGTTYGSNMTHLALEALAPILDAALRDRGYDPQPLDLSRLLNKRGKNFNG